MVTTIQEAARIFEAIDLKHAAYLKPLNMSVIDFIDFHVTPSDIQVIFIRDMENAVKQTILAYFSEFVPTISA